MATITHTIQSIASGIWVYTWTNLTTTNNVGDAVSTATFADKSVEVLQSGTSATVVIEGSNQTSSPSYFTLRDPFSVALSFTGNGLSAITENPYIIRPRISSGGDGTTSITVYLCVSTPTAYGLTPT